MNRWHTSSYSQGYGGNCIEVRESPTTIDLRDSQHPHLGHLALPAAEWAAFLHAARRGEL